MQFVSKKKVFVVALLALVMVFAISALALAADAPALKISGDVAKPAEYTLDAFKKLDMFEGKFTSLNKAGTKAEETLKGVKVADLLTAAEVKEGADQVTFVCADGYKLTMPLADATKEYEGKLFVIVIAGEDGKLSTATPQVDAEDVNKSKWAADLVEIVVGKAEATTEEKPEEKPAEGKTGVFTDVPADHWANAYIYDIFERKITTGMTDTTFAPEANLTRGQFVTFLGRLAGVKTAEVKGENKFTDIATTDYFYAYVLWAAENGITTGKTATSFAPADNLTRQEMATMLLRYADKFEISLTMAVKAPAYKDAASIAEWATDACNKTFRAGLVAIEEDESFRPLDKATRAEMAMALSKMPLAAAEEPVADETATDETKTDETKTDETKTEGEDAGE